MLISRNTGKNLLIAVVSVLASLLVVDLALRLFVRPAPLAAGQLFGIQLPPLRLLPSDYSAPSDAERRDNLQQFVSPGSNELVHLTYGDYWGIIREDPAVGYVPLENAISKNGWWQSNNIGARSRSVTEFEPPPGKLRALFFGDSYTQGSRVPQEETFQHYLGHQRPDLEAINLGVDGYSMAQAFLRYRQLEDSLRFDQVYLVIVPNVDLWRDINVVRRVADDWKSYMTYPRFAIEDDKPKLVSSPYPNLKALVEDNTPQVSKKLRNHLEAHDAFYFESGFEEIGLLDYSVLFRIFRALRLKIDRSRIYAELFNPDGEAVQVTSAIVAEMNRRVTEKNADFVLVVLPAEWNVRNYRTDSRFVTEWQNMVATLCKEGIRCIDLMKELVELPEVQLDRGYDETHYGPMANRAIASFLSNSIAR